MKKMQVSLLVCTLIAAQSMAQIPVFNSVAANTATVGKYIKFELTIDMIAAYTNPYNYDDISTKCIFISPTNRKDTVDGFYLENYALDTAAGTLTDLNTHNFKVRFAPNE